MIVRERCLLERLESLADGLARNYAVSKNDSERADTDNAALSLFTSKELRPAEQVWLAELYDGFKHKYQRLMEK